MCISFIKKNYTKMKKKELKLSKKTTKILNEIKSSTPKIVFHAKNIMVTLRSKEQLKQWLEKYPSGSYRINNA